MTKCNLSVPIGSNVADVPGYGQATSPEHHESNNKFSFLDLGALMRSPMPRTPTVPIPSVLFFLPRTTTRCRMLPFAKLYCRVGLKRHLVARVPNREISLRRQEPQVQLHARALFSRYSNHNAAAMALSATKHSWTDRKTERFIILADNETVKLLGPTVLLKELGTGRVIRLKLLKFKKRLWNQETFSVENNHVLNSWPRYRLPQLVHLVGVGINRISMAPVSQENPLSPSQKDYMPEDNYLALKDAAIDSRYSETQLLEYASTGDIKLCIPVQDGIYLRPFDKDTESTGHPPEFLPSLDKLILDPEYCKQIIDNHDHKTEQCNFRKGYILSFSKPKVLLPSYANPAFARTSCVWQALKEEQCFHIEIKQEDILVTDDELQSFIRRKPKQSEPKTTTSPESVATNEAKAERKSPATPKFIEAMQKLLDAIDKKMSDKALSFDKNKMPGKKEHFRELASKFDPKCLCVAETTFNDYIEGICKFPQGRHKNSAGNFYVDLFPDLYKNK